MNKELPVCRPEVVFKMNAMRPDVPGLLCPHGCSYMACRGLALSTIKDAFILTHGPVGCGYFAWGGLRQADEDIGIEYQGYYFSTSLEEEDIVFGAEKKLAKAIDEAVSLFHPKTILICSTCPVGLIGDDVNAVAKEAANRHGIQVLAFLCEGFKNVPGFRLSNFGFVNEVMGTGSKKIAPYSINVIGEYYTGETKKEIDEILFAAGIEVVSSLMGESGMEEIGCGHLAGLDVMVSGKPVEDIVQYAAQKYNAGWMKASFFGTRNIEDSFRRIAAFFKNEALMNEMHTALENRKAISKRALAPYRKEFEGLCAVISEDGFQTECFSGILQDLGIHCIIVRGEAGSTLYSAMQSHVYEVFVPDAFYIIADGFGEECRCAEDGKVLILHGKEKVAELLNVLSPDLCFWNLKEEFSIRSGLRPMGFDTDEHYVHFGGYCGLIAFAEQLKRGIFMAQWYEQSGSFKRRFGIG